MSRVQGIRRFESWLAQELRDEAIDTGGFGLSDRANYIARYLQDTEGLSEDECVYDSQTNTFHVLREISEEVPLPGNLLEVRHQIRIGLRTSSK